MSKKKNLYFAHPINMYGTDLENEVLADLKEAFPNWHIENPNQSKHNEGYQRYVAEGKRGMDYFFEEVLPTQAGVVCLPFPDGKIGKGVFEETERILKRTRKAWVVAQSGLIEPVWVLDKSRCLSVEETRSRVYLDRTTRTMRPYHEAVPTGAD